MLYTLLKKKTEKFNDKCHWLSLVKIRFVKNSKLKKKKRKEKKEKCNQYKIIDSVRSIIDCYSLKVSTILNKQSM